MFKKIIELFQYLQSDKRKKEIAKNTISEQIINLL